MRWTRDDVTVDTTHGVVERGGKPVALTAKENELLRYLAERPGRWVSRDTLLRELWGYHPGTRSRAVDKTLHRLRAKLEADPSAPTWLHSRRGEGVRLTPPATPVVAPPVRDVPVLVGREDALEAFSEWWDGPGRLLTVLGVGGLGKTTLARACAARISEAGALLGWVEAAGLSSPDGLVRAVADVLGLPGGGHDERTAVTDALRAHGRVLLVLDDLDAVAPRVAPLLQEWLAHSGVRLLATSRVRLRMAAEVLLQLQPLSQAESITVLKRRSRWTDARALGQLAVRLEGIPLALELAAAHGPLMPAKVVLQRLERFLDHTTPRVGPSHHRSMAAAIDHSWSRIAPEDQHALVATAALGGSVSLEAAEAAVGTLGAVTALVRLIDASLLRWEGEHLTMFAVVRSFALSRSEPAAQAEARRRLAVWLMEEALPVVDDCAQGTEAEALGRLVSVPALLAASTQALSDEDADRAGVLAYLQFHARWGRMPALDQAEALEGVLALPGADPWTRLRVKVCVLRCRARAGDLDAARRLSGALRTDLAGRSGPRASLLWRMWAVVDLPPESGESRMEVALPRLTEPRHRARGLAGVSRSRLGRGDVSGARAALDEASALYRQLGDVRGEAWLDLARSAMVESWDEARSLVRRCDRHIAMMGDTPLRDKVSTVRLRWRCELLHPSALQGTMQQLRRLTRVGHLYDAALLAQFVAQLQILAGDGEASQRSFGLAREWNERLKSRNQRFLLQAEARSALLWGDPALTLAQLPADLAEDDVPLFRALALADLGQLEEARATFQAVRAPWVQRIVDGERGEAVLEDSFSQIRARMLMQALDARPGVVARLGGTAPGSVPGNVRCPGTE